MTNCEYAIQNSLSLSNRYLQSSFVPKVVILLLDSGLVMRSPITHSNETYLDKAVNTALKFLKTLREGIDFVNIMCFDGDGNLRTPNSTPVKYNQTLQDQNFSDSLADIVNNNSVVTDPSALHTSNAINTAIIHLNNSIPIQIPEGYLKVGCYFLILLCSPVRSIIATNFIQAHYSLGDN